MVADATHGGAGREPFVGRAVELDQLNACVDKVVAGSPQVVRVEGDAGIGKTYLIRKFLRHLDGFTVLTASADAVESALTYGVLDQLLSRADPDLLGQYELLSRRPASAAPFSIGADLLELISELQQVRPLAIVVDDLQWTDRASAQALGFLLRRLWTDHVLVVLAVRTSLETDEAAAVTQYLSRHQIDSTTIRLPGFTLTDVAALCASVTPGVDLTPPAAARLREHTAGNPLYVRALLDEASTQQLLTAGANLPVPRSLRATVADTLRRLPAPSRRLVEALAVLNSRSPLAKVAALAGVDNPSEALASALDSQLVRWWPNEPANPVALHHALQRDAIYETLGPTRKAELHSGAIHVVDTTSAWAHRVSASTSTDPRLADELEQAAAEATAGGEHVLAARYLNWAADLSHSRGEYERRLLTACIHSLLTSRPEWAVGMRDDMERCADTALRRCALGLTDLFGTGDLAAAERSLQDTIDLTGTPKWITSTAAGALSGLHLWRGRGAETVDAAALALSEGQLPTRMTDFVRMFGAVGRSRRDGLIAGLDALAHLPPRPTDAADEDLECLACRGAMNTMLGRYLDAVDDLTVTIERQRAGAETLAGPTPHSYLAAAQFALGRWDDAAVTVHQALSLQASYEQPQHYTLVRMVASLVPAQRGDWSTAHHHVQAAQKWAATVDTPQDRRYAAIAAALLSRAREDVDGMRVAMDTLSQTDGEAPDSAHVWWQAWWHPLLVDTLLGTGRLDEAAHQLGLLEEAMVDVDNVADVLCRLRAKLARQCGRLDESLAIYQLAVAERQEPRLPLPLARLQHEYGRLLLTTGHRRAARTWLGHARHLFVPLAARPYLRRVDLDLAAAGASPRARSAEVHPVLTEREQQVMHLARRGLTNREIAKELFVTAKTVEYHLSNVFGKVGVTSRRQLRDLD